LILLLVGLLLARIVLRLTAYGQTHCEQSRQQNQTD
jgi:hypothetical protein